MGLKNARLARAENLPEETRIRIGKTEGLVIIESRNPELREEVVPIKQGGIREYLLTLGDFEEAELEDE